MSGFARSYGLLTIGNLITPYLDIGLRIIDDMLKSIGA
jgi:hypothetical protein